MIPHDAVSAMLRGRKAQLLPWQIDWLFTLATPYNGPDRRILEVGTGTGTSLLTLALAAKQADITTLDHVPRGDVVDSVRLRTMPTRIHHIVGDSAALSLTLGVMFDLIFIDADHRTTMADLAWFNHLRDGGLLLFHDYSDAEVYVRQAVDALGVCLGRPPDELMSYDGVGMAGYYRRGGERWQTTAPPPT